jgi:hypothetical protein
MNNDLISIGAKLDQSNAQAQSIIEDNLSYYQSMLIVMREMLISAPNGYIEQTNPLHPKCFDEHQTFTLVLLAYNKLFEQLYQIESKQNEMDSNQ